MAVKRDVLIDVLIKVVALVVIAYLVYKLLESQGIIKKEYPTSTATTPECPQGPEYSRGFFGDCAPNYVFSGWLDEKCKCLSTGK